jgi:8-oxo-dGTP pyrophosphatase MutT (NUDIX family)
MPQPAQRIIRYQGAIVRDDHILLIRFTEPTGGRSFWLIPGGGIEAEETEAACVQREMREETGLEVRVARLLLDEPAPAGDFYQRQKTYLCRVVGGDARPGYEPGIANAEDSGITAVGWFDLRDAASWNDRLAADSITYRLLQRIQAALGYPVSPRVTPL